MFKRILVPLDGSRFSEQALEPAVKLAETYGAELILLRVPVYISTGEIVVPEYAAFGPSEPMRPIRDEVIDYLHDIKQRKSRPNLTIQTLVEDGDQAGVIVDSAEAHNVDLIVMAAHTRNAIAKWMFGSVTERVLHSAPCPVLVLRGNQPIRNVIITLDGSELAEASVAPAWAVASAHGAAITLLCVHQAADSDPEMFDTIEQYEHGMGQRLLEDSYRKEEAYLEQIAVRLNAASNPVESVVIEGKPAVAIANYTSYAPVDLIAMTTHGRTGMPRWLYGSVTEKVMRNVPCHMLIVRSRFAEAAE